MERERYEFIKTQVSQTEPVEWRRKEQYLARSYRTPQLFVIGKAVDLVQRDGNGHLKDGTGGWWVWGS
jgi:hypothetical protein